MSKGFRTFLFWFFALVFCAATPAIVLYAQGYRLDWPPESGKKLIVKTGGFFVKASPKQISIYVNGELEKQTDFFFDSALVENLLPRNYKFEIKKNGYQPWEKKLEIKETQVVEARNIVLFPAQLDFSAIEKNILAVLPSPDGKKIALRQSDETGWNLKLYDIEQNITAKLAGQNNFSMKNPEFGDWVWTNTKNLETAVKSKTATSTYAIAVDKNPAQISQKPTAIKNGKAAPNATSTLEIAINKSGAGDYYLASDGYIYKKNGQEDQTPAIPAKIEIIPETTYELFVFDNNYFIKTGSQLAVYNSETKTFEKIIDNLAGEPKLSPNSKKIVYCSNSEIWIMLLEDKTDQPAGRANEKIFLARFSEDISGCQWFNSDYLIFIAGSKIKIAETDWRDKINIVDLADISKITGEEKNDPAQIFFNFENKTAYLFAGNVFYKSAPIE